MDKIGDQWTHVAVETEVINKVEAQGTADEVELKYMRQINVKFKGIIR